MANPPSSGAAPIDDATIAVGVGALSFDEVVAVARCGGRVEIASEALEELRSRGRA